MKIINCDHCGERVVIGGRGEAVESGETPLEHMERTGHSHRREPRLTGCDTCGNVWYYTGSADRATCPNCRDKAAPGEVPTTDD